MSLNYYFKIFISKHKKYTLKKTIHKYLPKFRHNLKYKCSFIFTRSNNLSKQFNILYKKFVLNKKIKEFYCTIIQRFFKKYIKNNYYKDPCCICFELINNNDIYIADCRSNVHHVFHYNCLINNSINYNNLIFCPICRKILLYTNVNIYYNELYYITNIINHNLNIIKSFIDFYLYKNNNFYIIKELYFCKDLLLDIYMNIEYIYKIKFYKLYSLFSK